MSRQSHIPLFEGPNNIWWRTNVYSFLHHPIIACLWSQNILLGNL